jgi:hypothetical protein
MSKSRELTPEERLPDPWSDPELRSKISKRFRNLEEWAVSHWRRLARGLSGGNEIESWLAQAEKGASSLLRLFVDELPESCSAAEARTWAQTRQALDWMLELELDLENEPEIDLFPRVIMTAVAVLAHTQECRHELETGSPNTAALAMARASQNHYWLQMDHLMLMDRTLRPWLEGPRRGREKHLENRHREHAIWLGELRRLKLLHPNWSRTKIAKEIGRTASPPRHRTTVLKTLKRLEENEGSDS